MGYTREQLDDAKRYLDSHTVQGFDSRFCPFATDEDAEVFLDAGVEMEGWPERRPLTDSVTDAVMELAAEAKRTGAEGWKEAELQTRDEVREEIVRVLPSIYEAMGAEYPEPSAQQLAECIVENGVTGFVLP